MIQALEGIYIPREDFAGWEIQIGGEVYTDTNPDPIALISCELDAIGTLTGASIALKSPRHPIFPPYTVQAWIRVLSKTRGTIEVCTGYVPGPSEDGREEYTLEMRPLEELSKRDYFDGTFGNAAGELNEAGAWMAKNEEVISSALKGRPKASIGVATDGRVYLTEPAGGQPVQVSQARFHKWKSTGFVDVPYATRSRWDGGRGWLKGEYVGIQRPAYAPRVALDAGEVTFREIVRETGPPLVTVAELVVNPAPDEYAGAELDSSGNPTTDPPPGSNTTPPLPGGGEFDPVNPSGGVVKVSTSAEQFAVVHVYDLGAWYAGSALAGQENETVKKLQDAVNAAQNAFRLSADVLGTDHPFTKLEGQQVGEAQNRLRLGQIGEGDKQSGYEPLTARLSTGFVLDAFIWQPTEPPTQSEISPSKIGYTLLTGTTVWLSTSAFDTAAVGLATEGQDAGTPEQFVSLIHPLESESTIKVFASHLVELDEYSRNTPFQQGALEIPPEYFRSPMGPNLAAILDEKWRQSFEPDPPPEDQFPPSETWDGEWYFYIACWWRVMGETEQEYAPS